MSPHRQRFEVGPAITDLKNRTLARLPGDFSRLLYLASCRDLNTGNYSHDGLAFHFGENVASKAIAACHQEIFGRLVFFSLEELIRDMRQYISSVAAQPRNVLQRWMQLGSYRITIPLDCDDMAAEIFLSNVKIALAILKKQTSAFRDERSA